MPRSHQRSERDRRRAGAAVGAAIVVLALAATALAAAPRGNANYVAVDKAGRPAVTLWMRTKTTMYLFACYRWGTVDHGDHYNNVKPITVKPDGVFSYQGPGSNLHQRQATLKLSGHFVSKDEAVGTLSAPCGKNYRFVARYAP